MWFMVYTAYWTVSYTYLTRGQTDALFGLDLKTFGRTKHGPSTYLNTNNVKNVQVVERFGD